MARKALYGCSSNIMGAQVSTGVGARAPSKRHKVTSLDIRSEELEANMANYTRQTSGRSLRHVAQPQNKGILTWVKPPLTWGDENAPPPPYLRSWMNKIKRSVFPLIIRHQFWRILWKFEDDLSDLFLIRYIIFVTPLHAISVERLNFWKLFKTEF